VLNVSGSLHADNAQALHDRLTAHGVPILTEPFNTVRPDLSCSKTRRLCHRHPGTT